MRETIAHQMDVVAHPLGGVITRRMLHGTDYGVKAREAIRTVILLGTPNGGSPCSDTLIVSEYRELAILAMTAFNGDYPGNPGANSIPCVATTGQQPALLPELGIPWCPHGVRRYNP